MSSRAKTNLLNFVQASVVFSFMLWTSASSQAQIVPGLGEVVNEGRKTLGTGTVESETIYLEAGRSYECTLLSDTTSDQVTLEILSSMGTALDAAANSLEQIGDVTPVVSSGTSGAANKDNRLTITPATTDQYSLRLTNNSFIVSQDIKRGCIETSIYGGYNTNANPFNFLELTNTTNTTVTGRVRGFNFDGTATINSTFSIAANTRFDIDVHTAAGANRYGALIVTHNGPYGALKGAVSQYSGPVSALELRATVPLKPREQTF